jgi:hypothetical protein
MSGAPEPLLSSEPWFPLSPERTAEIQKRVMDRGIPKTQTEWWARREILDLLEFVREQIKECDRDGDMAFPLYDHGMRILERHKADRVNEERRGKEGGVHGE